MNHETARMRVLASGCLLALLPLLLQASPSAGTRYLHNDHLGSAVAVSDGLGQVRARVRYQAWGALKGRGSDTGTGDRARFTGKALDSPAGLYYFGARHLDPRLGRFLGPDPARQSSSPYAYAGAAPLVNVDPDGAVYEFLAEVLERWSRHGAPTRSERLAIAIEVRDELKARRLSFLTDTHTPWSSGLDARGTALLNAATHAEYDYLKAESSVRRFLLWVKQDRPATYEALRLTPAGGLANDTRHARIQDHLERLERQRDNMEIRFGDKRSAFYEWADRASPALQDRADRTFEYQEELGGNIHFANKYTKAMSAGAHALPYLNELRTVVAMRELRTGEWPVFTPGELERMGGDMRLDYGPEPEGFE